MTTAPATPSKGRFVTTQWLAERLGAPDVVVVDASWHLPTAGRSARAEYADAHIPGAVFFDIDAVADRSSGLPHMLPTEPAFDAAVGALGIGDGMTIVVYDSLGLFSAARGWWTFFVFGAPNVFVLEGGLPQWRDEGRPLEAGEVSRPPARFTARLDRSRVAGADQVAQASEEGSAQILDARSAPRFRGEEAEPRPGVRPGHIPGALNLPFGEVLANGRLKSPEEVRQAVTAAGVDPSRPVITSCGSGVTAAILWLALDSLGTPPAALYDGSWSEWGASTRLIAIGPA
ncbi:3-mercaptopyruvate sulfurtransferase [Ancylobacter oerskovii]|uniref:Sulfurtransferase n=1 Tax=Ancylobacter oerskovii TaxID=459519 RepID=A0ABW4YYL2_9HYPH|nr:3-mercaptopyruvate sulfurtransferase [Ancylobacter oerskovii]MBS7541594.1 3-mercaptopyruvate sulfurtransferase [Ancylobacter oerskovii]